MTLLDASDAFEAWGTLAQCNLEKYSNGPRGEKEFDPARELRNIVPEKFSKGLGCDVVTLIETVNDNDERSITQGRCVTKGFKYKLLELFINSR